MSNYVYNTSLTYPDYLQAKSFVEDIRMDQQAVVCEVSEQTREIVASLEEIGREHITAVEGLRGDVAEGVAPRHAAANAPRRRSATDRSTVQWSRSDAGSHCEQTQEKTGRHGTSDAYQR